MDALLRSLAEEPTLLTGIILGLAGMACFVVVVTLVSSASVKQTREREVARREIAAYVAEGSLSSEDAERILHPRPWYARAAWTDGLKGHGAAVRQAARDAARGLA